MHEVRVQYQGGGCPKVQRDDADDESARGPTSWRSGRRSGCSSRNSGNSRSLASEPIRSPWRSAPGFSAASFSARRTGSASWCWRCWTAADPRSWWIGFSEQAAQRDDGGRGAHECRLRARAWAARLSVSPRWRISSGIAAWRLRRSASAGAATSGAGAVPAGASAVLWFRRSERLQRNRGGCRAAVSHARAREIRRRTSGSVWCASSRWRW